MLPSKVQTSWPSSVSMIFGAWSCKCFGSRPSNMCGGSTTWSSAEISVYSMARGSGSGSSACITVLRQLSFGRSAVVTRATIRSARRRRACRTIRMAATSRLEVAPGLPSRSLRRRVAHDLLIADRIGGALGDDQQHGRRLGQTDEVAAAELDRADRPRERCRAGLAGDDAV